ncbi:hypothetical protein [Pseudoalteromonas sp. S16_S37]|uniref:hypothetical protein n=1 Tax=Pseudoalteromonas sp. S16_S37 TaxID=2720228 RepID=UPI001680BCF1|nr:hypothetical protein [Pseudoalteromonas sp. S16_S37]MBD1582169.1 hypothetical protein [Pseudoalteromonas sp. S16_S37]
MINTCQPSLQGESFSCPHCGVYSEHQWLSQPQLASLMLSFIQDVYLSNKWTLEHSQCEKMINLGGNQATQFAKHFLNTEISISNCLQCNNHTVWIGEQMVYPPKSQVPEPNEDMPEAVKSIYLEAASILVQSPKGSAALLRLALQVLLTGIVGDGKIDKQINKLV